EQTSGTGTLTIDTGIQVQGGSGSIKGAGTFGATESIFNKGTFLFGSGSTLSLGGFTTAGLGVFVCSGATINLAGTLTNTPNTLALAAALVNCHLAGGTIIGGTITSSGGSTLILTNAGGTLAGVTVAAGVTIDGTQTNANFPQTTDSASVTGGMILNGTILLG